MSHAIAIDQKIGKLIAHAWMDPDFYQRLSEFPSIVLQEAGISAEEFVKVVAKILPVKPADLVDDTLTACIENFLASKCRTCTT